MSTQPASIGPVSDYELGLWQLERRAEIASPALRAQDRLLRALESLWAARSSLALQAVEIQDLRAQLRVLRREVDWRRRQDRRKAEAVVQVRRLRP